MNFGVRVAVALLPCVWLGCAPDSPPEPGGGRRNPSGVGVVPAQRPSASPWMDPPGVSTEPCCDVGALLGADSLDSQASHPAAVWNGAGWALAWGDFNGHQPSRGEIPMLRLLDENAQPMPGPIAVQGPTERPHAGVPTAIGWDQGRYALLAATPSNYQREALAAQLLLVDERGTLLKSASIERASDGGALTRFSAASAWALATYDDLDGGRSGASRLVLFNDELERIGKAVDLGRTLYADWRTIEVVPLESRLVVAQATDAGIALRTFAGPNLDEGPPVAPVPTGSWFEEAPTSRTDTMLKERTVAAIGAGRLRDTVVLAAMNHAQVRTWVFDPIRNAVLAGPTTVGSSTGYRTPGVAGDDVGGTAGICYPDGGGPRRDADTLKFALVGPDGAARGEPVVIASGLRYVAACTVAAGGHDEYVVALWNAAKGLDEQRPSISYAHVRVRREIATSESPSQGR
jgi:hypothetical protein